MGVIQDLFNTYIASVNADVTVKVAVNSIDPVDVGNIGAGLSAFVPYWERINLQTITQGSADPVDATGENGDDYWQDLISGFKIWRKENGIWVVKITETYGFTIEDGILSGLRTFINGNIVTVEKGSWSIANATYNKTVQTQFTVPIANANYLRYDLIYADTNNAILYLAGTASVSPAYPATPANCIMVDYVVVPSVANGANPYLLSGGTNSASVIVTGTSDASGNYDASGDNIPLFPSIGVYEGAVLVPASYNNTTKIISGLNTLTAFTAKFI